MKNHLKKFSLAILIVFWSYTWHAYAIGAVSHEDSPGEPQKAVLKTQPSQSDFPSSLQKKLQFKKRPFIAKGDVILLQSLHLNPPTVSVEYVVPLKNLVFGNSPQINHRLRSPPSL